MSVVGVVRVVEQRVGGIVRGATMQRRSRREGHSGGRRVIEADQRILDHVVVVVGQVHSEAFAGREGCGESVVTVVSHVLGLYVGVGVLEDIDGPAQDRPRPRGIGRLEAVARFLARRHADEHAVVVGVLQIEIQAQGMGGPRPEPEQRRFLQAHEMVHVSGQIIVEVVEVPIAIAVADAGSQLFSKCPRLVRSDFSSSSG